MPHTEPDRSATFDLVNQLTDWLKDAVPVGYAVMLAVCHEDGGPVGASLGGTNIENPAFSEMIICLAGKVYEGRYTTGATRRMVRGENQGDKQ